jgi:anaphase-promoting complex subunit 1
VRLFGSQNYYNQLARTTARESMNVVGIAMAMVMAGTGDLELFKALRTTQCRIATDMVHGDYLAASIGIGLLFLGGGRTTLNRSNRSIALMLCAFYPQFPATPEDNGPHLQVFRHLWAMAAEQRGIIACDVNTGEACSVNIELKVIEDTPATHTPVRIRDDIDGDDVQYVNGQLVRKVYMKTPCIFPPFDKIYSLKVVDEKYFPVELTPSSNPVHAKILETYNIIYVKQLRSRSSSKRVSLYAVMPNLPH